MSDTKDVRITRTLNAPLSKVWDMWIKAENFAKWYGPTGARITNVRMELSVSGKRHFAMEMDSPNGPMTLWLVGEFIEIDEPNKLVYSEIMSNEQGEELAPSAFGMPGDIVQRTTVTVEFEEVEGNTKVTMTHAGVPDDSPGAQGWEMALDKFVSAVEA